MPLTPKQRFIIESFLDGRVTRFRRSDIAAALHRSINPRSDTRATALADEALRMLGSEGRILREGHLHWKVARRHRELISGKCITECEDVVSIPLMTRVPQKWVLVDLETGDRWQGTQSGKWARADTAAVAGAADILTKARSSD